MGCDGRISEVHSSVRYPPHRRVHAIGSDLDRETPDTVSAVAVIHEREIDQRSHGGVAADVDVFRMHTAGAHMDESRIPFYMLAAQGMGGIGRRDREKCTEKGGGRGGGGGGLGESRQRQQSH